MGTTHILEVPRESKVIPLSICYRDEREIERGRGRGERGGGGVVEGSVGIGKVVWG